MRSMTMTTSRAALGSPHQTVRTAPQALWWRGSNKRKIENTIERSTRKAAPPAKAGTRRKKMPEPSPPGGDGCGGGKRGPNDTEKRDRRREGPAMARRHKADG